MKMGPFKCNWLEPVMCESGFYGQIRIRSRWIRIWIQEKKGGFGFSWIRIRGAWIRGSGFEMAGFAHHWLELVPHLKYPLGRLHVVCDMQYFGQVPSKIENTT